jgi:class 3 adenylate cyclase
MKRFRAPIWLVLALAFAGLVVLTTAVVAARLYSTALRSTVDLVAEMGDTRTTALAEAVKAELQPAEDASRFLSEYILSGRVPVNDDRRIEDLLLGSLAASPQVIGVAFIRSDLYTIAAARSVNGMPFATTALSALENPQFRLQYRNGAALQNPDWGAPIFWPDLNVTGLPLLAPLRRNGEVIGVIATLISVPEFSHRVLRRTGEPGFDAFVLLDDSSLIVHPTLDARFEGTEDKPLPKAAEVADPVLRAFDPMNRDQPDLHPGRALNFSVQQKAVDGTDWIYLSRAVDVVGSKPWISVLAVRASDLAMQFNNLQMALWVSLGMATAAVLGGLYLGRSISRPIGNFASAARRLNALEFDQTQPMKGSWLREFDIAAEAYNGMRSGLTWFATYVPRTLVQVLMQPDSAESFTAKEREVTVLFTDIVGFTAIGHRLRPPALARFINRHFEILGEAIEAEGGTIDKYIGDSVMAFWGAPVVQGDHVERAARAAIEIGHRLNADNTRRKRKGLNPVRVRIGIHAGLALAGNIGAPGRINYTLVGETVNVAQRLEQFCKEIDDGRSDVIIAISSAVADRLPVEIPTHPLGKHAVVERGEPMLVFRLDGVTDPAANAGAAITPLRDSAARL